VAEVEVDYAEAMSGVACEIELGGRRFEMTGAWPEMESRLVWAEVGGREAHGGVSGKRPSA
jgi:hypothetical protein